MSPKAWGPIRQLAYVVDDLDAAIERWIALHGVGPWTVYRNACMQGRYRGSDTSVLMHVGLSYQNSPLSPLLGDASWRKRDDYIALMPNPNYGTGPGQTTNGIDFQSRQQCAEEESLVLAITKTPGANNVRVSRLMGIRP